MLRLPQVADEAYGLDGLAHPHIVGEQAIDIVGIEGDHPLESVELVWLQTAESIHLARLAHGRNDLLRLALSLGFCHLCARLLACL